MPGLAPPSSINDTRTRAMVQVYERLGQIDLSKILVYIIDNVPDAALPFLAWQFDVQSSWFQALAGTTSQREVIKQAIPLHSKMGTPYAVKTILSVLGYGAATLQEGQNSWGGTFWPASQGWAVFRVILPVTGPVTAATQHQVIDAINFFKPETRRLDQVIWQGPAIVEPALAPVDHVFFAGAHAIFERPLAVTDSITVPGWAIADVKTIVAIHDAHFLFAGGIFYGATQPPVVDDGVVINGVPVA